MALGPNEYQCAKCGNVYNKGWTDEEAKAEACEVFPGLDSDNHEESAILCDDCYNEMMAWLRNN
jgi:DNA-directed RNA polymerase subunit RPC12/RpoP